MSTINIQICINNDAFVDNLTDELQRILNAPQIVTRLYEEPRRNGDYIPLLDSNGNAVGHAWVTT